MKAAKEFKCKLGERAGVCVRNDHYLCKSWTMKNETAAIKADAGMVKTQAQTTVRATPHLTAESLRVAPTPTIAPVIV